MLKSKMGNKLELKENILSSAESIFCGHSVSIYSFLTCFFPAEIAEPILTNIPL